MLTILNKISALKLPFVQKSLTINPEVLDRAKEVQWTINHNLFNTNRLFFDTYSAAREGLSIDKIAKKLENNKALAENYATQLAYEKACKKHGLKFDVKA